jgi:methionyl-tRNA formyltransferase
MKTLRTVFFWTPWLSANILTYLLQQDNLDIIGVVTTPDKPAWRGHQLIASPVAQLAREKNINLLQPEKIRDEAFLEAIRTLQPDICLVVAYGKILPQVLLDIPPTGFLNVHTSLLPKYRGAAPIQHALLAGEKKTGLTVQQMALGMDEGAILVQESWDITPEDTTGSLFARTGERGGPLLMQALEWLVEKTITPISQNPSEATYANMIEKKNGELQFSWTVDEAYHAWQAYTPWPGLFIFYGDIKLSLLKIKKMTNDKWRMTNEGLFIVDKLPAIQLQDGYILLEQVHPAGKKPMTGEEFVRGFMWKVKGEK